MIVVAVASSIVTSTCLGPLFSLFWGCFGNQEMIRVRNLDCRIISLARVSSKTQNLQRVFRRILDTNWGSLCQAFLADTVKTGTKNRCVIEATHV